MKRKNTLQIALCTSIAVLATTASAQTGTLDQESPVTNIEFNIDAPSLTWQQQVRADLAGQLEGISLHFSGNVGTSQATVSIGLGDAWSINLVFDTIVTLQEDDAWHFIDTTSANIQLQPGDTFVIQTNGNDTGMWINGTYVAPPGEPMYDEPLFLDGDNYHDGGWRHGLKSYMLTGSDDCLTMTVTNLVAGADATWDVCGASNGNEVAIVYGFNNGSTIINGFAKYCADFGIQGVNQKRIVCRKRSDRSGCISCTKTIPANIAGARILTQATQKNTCPDPCMSILNDQIVE